MTAPTLALWHGLPKPSTSLILFMLTVNGHRRSLDEFLNPASELGPPMGSHSLSDDVHVYNTNCRRLLSEMAGLPSGFLINIPMALREKKTQE
ncbi:hypothetical protein N7491_008324 [Penicillium cf. griseofulvum]|nr:hypothetical protein N7491_008324 [Penicillium cf. griseofulvum]